MFIFLMALPQGREACGLSRAGIAVVLWVWNGAKDRLLAYVLAQLLLADDSISVGEMHKHLRSLHCLYQPEEDPKLVSMHEDGTLVPITLAEAIDPVRTYIPSMMDAQIPDIIEFINVA
jgi:hypothetical protein